MVKGKLRGEGGSGVADDPPGRGPPAHRGDPPAWQCGSPHLGEPLGSARCGALLLRGAADEAGGAPPRRTAGGALRARLALPAQRAHVVVVVDLDRVALGGDVAL